MFAPQESADAATPEASVTAQITDASDIILDKVTGWVEGFIELLPNLAVAIVVVLVFVLLAKVLRNVVRRLLEQISDNTQVRELLATVVYVAIIAAGVFVALGLLNLDKTVSSLLAGVGILGLALGFAFQDIAANFVSGVLLAFRRPFSEGDLAEVNGLFGRIQHVTLRSTIVRDLDGQIVYVPNKDVFANPIRNFSTLGERRVAIAVGVSYDDDLETAKRAALEAVKSLSMCKEDRPVELYYNEFGGSSINFTVRFWIDFKHTQPDYLEAQSQAIIAIKKAFDENDVSIPFPIRTLDLGDNVSAFREAFAPSGASNGSAE